MQEKDDVKQEEAVAETTESSAEEMLRTAVEGKGEVEETDESSDDTDVKEDDAPTKKKDSDHVPRKRLNEELEKRKSLERELETLKADLSVKKTVQPREDADTKKFIKEMADDHFEGNIEAATKFHKRQTEIAQKAAGERISAMEATMANITTKLALKEVIAEDPIAQKYETEVLEQLSHFTPELRVNKRVISDAITFVKGMKFDEAIKEAEQRGSKRSEEKKRIVSIGDSEKPSSDKEKGTSLTPAERAMAQRLGMSESAYSAGKKAK